MCEMMLALENDTSLREVHEHTHVKIHGQVFRGVLQVKGKVHLGPPPKKDQNPGNIVRVV